MLSSEWIWVRKLIEQIRHRSRTRAITAWASKIWKNQKIGRNCDWLNVRKRRKCLRWLPDLEPQLFWLDQLTVGYTKWTEALPHFVLLFPSPMQTHQFYNLNSATTKLKWRHKRTISCHYTDSKFTVKYDCLLHSSQKRALQPVLKKKKKKKTSPYTYKRNPSYILASKSLEQRQ